MSLHDLGIRTLPDGEGGPMAAGVVFDTDGPAVVMTLGDESMRLPVVLDAGFPLSDLVAAIDADPSGFIFAPYGHNFQRALYKLKSAQTDVYYGWCTEPLTNIDGNNKLRFVVGNVVVYVTSDENGNGVVTTAAL